ncbi:DUF3737 family protein [Tetragenococcus muriaticus]|uniref:DUF3737 family protein n=1 Tax=Tetragenococcus muriaticus TaxID=64642 RepID=UPI00040E83D9|nr:DUF3737 family protein [Tetragenococcus muriaticus]GMA47569.1 hypothetical protein GCM10025854_18190 [Tetragenococcus muriaticus]
MNQVNQQLLTGERALFKEKEANVTNSVFQNGESPLKESADIYLENDIFRWKYPIWYSDRVKAENITLTDTARSGIWYTHYLQIFNSIMQAPKTFRRATNIVLDNVQLSNAQETFWNCQDLELKQVTATGDYFAMNSKNIQINDFSLVGNYSFDGCSNVEIRNAKMISKDALWNCENVTIYDSTIIGEYLGWNSTNITLVNCFIESEQGMCYMENLHMDNCTVINTDLAFEYSTVKATINSTIDSVKNPISGEIQSLGIDELIFDDEEIQPEQTKMVTQERNEHVL